MSFCRWPRVLREQESDTGRQDGARSRVRLQCGRGRNRRERKLREVIGEVRRRLIAERGERARKRERADGLAEGVMRVVADAPAMRIHFEDLAGGIGEVEDDFEGA